MGRSCDTLQEIFGESGTGSVGVPVIGQDEVYPIGDEEQERNGNHPGDRNGVSGCFSFSDHVPAHPNRSDQETGPDEGIESQGLADLAVDERPERSSSPATHAGETRKFTKAAVRWLDREVIIKASCNHHDNDHDKNREGRDDDFNLQGNSIPLKEAPGNLKLNAEEVVVCIFNVLIYLREMIRCGSPKPM